MEVLAIDLGGTKLAMSLFSETGQPFSGETVELNGKRGDEVGMLIVQQVRKYLDDHYDARAIGVAVPGIYSAQNGTVWAPNIPGWEKYPLMDELQLAAGKIPVVIDSDRACYILGEVWKGNAKSCRDAIFIAVGTGIGAGIITGGKVLRGSHDIAGAIGWMALDRPFKNEYISCGCFEHHASGEGMAKIAAEKIETQDGYNGSLNSLIDKKIKAQHVFEALDKNDQIAQEVIAECIGFWGMAVANLVSLFNPEKIIFGGGIFGPAATFLPAIKEEATKWAQPISMQQVTIEPSALGSDAGLYGAAYLAHDILTKKTKTDAL